MIFRIFLALTLLFCSSFGQKYDFLKFSEENGLNVSQVTAVYQLSSGALAVGTLSGGLSLYNGSEFKNYAYNEGLGSNTITDIDEDSKGNLWLSTYKGLTKFDGKEFINYEKIDGEKNVIVWDCLIESDSLFWLSTRKGLIKFNGSDFVNISKELLGKELTVWVSYQLDSKEIYFGTEDGLYLLSDNEVISFDELKGKYIVNILLDSYNNLWLTADDALLIYSDNQFISPPFLSEFDLSDVSAIYKDNDGNIWIGRNGSPIIKYSKSNTIQFGKNEGYNESYVWNFYEDSYQNVWIASDYGLFVLNNSNCRLLHSKSPWALMNSERYGIMSGTDDEGIYVYNGSKFKIFNTPLKETKTVRCFYEEPTGEIWMGTDLGLVREKNGNFKLFDKSNGFLNDSVMDIEKDYIRNKLLVAAFYYGIYSYNGKSFNYLTLNDAISQFYCIEIDKNNDYWIGTDLGFYIYGDSLKIIPEELGFLKNYEIIKIIYDKSNDVYWLAAFGKGIIKYSPSLPTNDSKRIEIFDVSKGLNDNTPLLMIKDKNENLWVGTNQGLNVFIQKEDSIEIIPFYRADGLLGTEVVQNSTASDDNGNLYFGTTRGILTFHPDEVILSNREALPKIISCTSLSAEDSFEYTKSFLFFEQDYQSFITIPNHNNNVRLEYCGIDFPTTYGTKYSYKLNDLSWSEPTSETSANFNNLDAGNYKFSVRTKSPQGNFSRHTASIRFTITEPFYKKGWFTIPIYSIGIIFIGLFGYTRYRGIKKRNEFLNENILKRKKSEEQLRKHSSDLQLINDLNLALNSGKSLEKIISIASKSMEKMFDGMGAAFYLVDDEEKNLVLKNPGVYRHFFPKLEDFIGHNIPEIKIPLDSDHIYIPHFRENTIRFANTKKIVLETLKAFADVTIGKKNWSNKFAREMVVLVRKQFDITSIITLPLFTGKKMIGLVDISSNENFSDESLLRIKLLVAQLTIIIERKLNEIEMIKAKENAQKAEKLKTEFLAQMSHEIRSPVHTILSFNQLLNSEFYDKASEEMQESFQAIEKAGRRVVRTIDLILNMSQIQTDTYECDFTNINIDKSILLPLVKEYRYTAKSKNLALFYNIETEDSNITGDEYTLNQIFANLIDNAIKYTKKGSVFVKLFRNGSGKLTVTVSDTGIGITKEYIPKIFESFSQEEQGYTRKYEGSGLGLALVKNYCKFNNATISVESEKGKGSIFKVIFN